MKKKEKSVRELVGSIPGSSFFDDGFGSQENQKKARRARQSVVYFIREGSPGGPIKIGYSSIVKGRLSSIQTGNSSPVVVLGTFSGGEREEGEVHRRFAHLRGLGEWFFSSDDLLQFIEEKCGVIVDRPKICR